MALASAFNVDVIALNVDARVEAEKIGQKNRNEAKNALRLGFFINLASYLFGLIVFTVISLTDGVEGYAMLAPAIWWGVGVAGFGLALVIVELTMYFKYDAPSAGA